jgi:Fe-S-cluster-containing hydrogenase component 2
MYKGGFIINQERCLGCSQCANICPQKAIKMESKLIDYKEVLPILIEKGIDCIEFHAISEDENDVDEKWQQINDMFDGLLCISLDRSELGDRKLKERVERMIKAREPYSTIIQADGIAMSGNNDELMKNVENECKEDFFNIKKQINKLINSEQYGLKDIDLNSAMYEPIQRSFEFEIKIMEKLAQQKQQREKQEVIEN